VLCDGFFGLNLIAPVTLRDIHRLIGPVVHMIDGIVGAKLSNATRERDRYWCVLTVKVAVGEVIAQLVKNNSTFRGVGFRQN